MLLLLMPRLLILVRVQVLLMLMLLLLQLRLLLLRLPLLPTPALHLSPPKIQTRSEQPVPIKVVAEHPVSVQAAVAIGAKGRTIFLRG